MVIIITLVTDNDRFSARSYSEKERVMRCAKSGKAASR